VVANFVENPVRGAVEFVLYPAVFSVVHRLDRQVRRPRTRLLHRSARLFKLATTMVHLVSVPDEDE
jgi:hypothetical protein